MADPANHPFRREDLDQRLLSPKLQELAEEMQKRAAEGDRKATFDTQKSGNPAGYLSRFFELHLRLTDEWAKRIYDTHCEVWLIQGHSISPDFIREVSKAILELIAARKGAVAFGAQLWCTRTGHSSNIVALGGWNRAMDSLVARWARKLEAEAVASEYRVPGELAAKTPPERRDSDWIQSSERSIAGLPSEGVSGRQKSQQITCESAPPQTVAHGANSDLLYLPTGLQSTGDPIDENPFPVGDPRHKVWNDATRKAEEQWFRLSSESENTPFERPDALIAAVSKRVSAKFDVWANRGVRVVWSDGAVRAYDQWLVNYAEAWLQDVSARNLYGLLVPLQDLLANIRLALTKRVNWWKAEARMYLAVRNADLAGEKAPTRNSKPTLHTKRRPTPAIAVEAKLANPVKFPTMMVSEVVAALGISRASVYRYLDEGLLQRPGLNKKPGKRSRTLILTASVQRMLEPAKE